MYSRVRRLRHMFWVLPKIYPGASHRLSGVGINVLADGRSTASWYSTVSETKHKMLIMDDVLSFIRSSLHPRGSKNLFKADGIFLVLIGEYLEGSSEAGQNTFKMFEKAKSLLQRYPSLQVVGLQYGKSIHLKDTTTHLLQRIIKEFVTFPILLSNKNIFEKASAGWLSSDLSTCLTSQIAEISGMANVSCYVISKGFQTPIVYLGEDVDLKVLDQAIHDLNEENGKAANVEDMKSTWVKPVEVVKEPDVCSASRNLLFSFPGCMSVDESGNHLFLSDVNHHRIVVFNSNGKILDAIGSSPGFEDGEFEIAKLMRPAASFYHASENCLYLWTLRADIVSRACGL
ncbi:UNVERIFIED_CONTAM: hypothetical protein Scaly_0298300 [Sesamum calycinum]|uniref:NHL repeat-containing protein 2 n=1 Tax=Sesamum calycinum TaxID=2727403 RepID=A0AAW2SAR0_9LAMI